MNDNIDPLITAEAAKAWATFTSNEKALVRFGMFPAEKMTQLEAVIGKAPDMHRELAVALMDCAKADGGMRA